MNHEPDQNPNGSRPLATSGGDSALPESSGDDSALDTGIEFGKVEEAKPQPGLRPDQDRHYSVAPCGDVNEADLPIYVDMDVLRDMESHARENTRVELGGVMLGRHHVDSDGQPFVVISDSLRARHYEATRGSFKFTHDTWNQITRERNEFRSDLVMVGWYHTHPGWGIFLSGMDLFICNNFFDRPLDVALVIDPCADERGWFQWEEAGGHSTRQTAGFYLMTNRHRVRELNHFADVFGNQEKGYSDPRFRQHAFAADQPSDLENSIMNIVDHRRPLFEFAIISMLMLQLLVAGLIGWRMTRTDSKIEADGVEQRLALIEAQQQLDQQRFASSVREQAYGDILETIVASETGESGLVDRYASLASDNRLLTENLEGQLSRVNQSIADNKRLVSDLTHSKVRSKQLKNDLQLAENKLTKLEQEKDELEKSLAAETGEKPSSMIPGWAWYSLTALALLAVGGVAGYLLNRGSGSPYDDELDRPGEPSKAISHSDAEVAFAAEQEQADSQSDH